MLEEFIAEKPPGLNLAQAMQLLYCLDDAPIDRWILSRENRTRDVQNGMSIANRPWFSRPFWFG
ncbi:hypothetical protein [Prochlorococcus sp. MIT 1306]|uniref:hypothetical protein n=1 Tax=Prochlorococcus sp. MIT 1306 TaxID=1799667 RepID=UPI0007B3CFF5|nr:hypothetical protein [Prochlorococcus sp. MIT 1306]